MQKAADATWACYTRPARPKRRKNEENSYVPRYCLSSLPPSACDALQALNLASAPSARRPLAARTGISGREALESAAPARPRARVQHGPGPPDAGLACRWPLTADHGRLTTDNWSAYRRRRRCDDGDGREVALGQHAAAGDGLLLLELPVPPPYCP
jgi:hypothetical protein